MTIHGSSVPTGVHRSFCHYQQTSGKLLVPPVDQEPLDQEPSCTSEFTVMGTGSAVEVEACFSFDSPGQLQLSVGSRWLKLYQEPSLSPQTPISHPEEIGSYNKVSLELLEPWISSANHLLCKMCCGNFDLP